MYSIDEMLSIVKNYIYDMDDIFLFLVFALILGFIILNIVLLISNYKRKKIIHSYGEYIIKIKQKALLIDEVHFLIKKKDEFLKACNELKVNNNNLLTDVNSNIRKKEDLTKEIKQLTNELDELQARKNELHKFIYEIIQRKDELLKINDDKKNIEKDSLLKNKHYTEFKNHTEPEQSETELKVPETVLINLNEGSIVEEPKNPIVLELPVDIARLEPGKLKRIGYTPIFYNNDNYPAVYMPLAKSVIKFPRKGRFGARGISESKFKTYLEKFFTRNKNIKLYDDRLLVISENTKPYEPDFSLIDETTGNLNMFIDIEIDEPYDVYTREPIHFIGIDYQRNQFFTKRGWIVIRFSERQIIKNPLACCKYIANVIRNINADYLINNELLAVDSLLPEEFWSKEKADQYAKTNYRESYLKTTFASVTNTSEGQVVIIGEQSNDEIESERYVKHEKIDIIYENNEDEKEINKINIRVSKTEIIQKPLINGLSDLLSISDLISRYYLKKGKIIHINSNQSLKNQLIADIENYFQQTDLPLVNHILFGQFKSFYNNVFETIQIYKREWVIFDEETKISGTINLISSNGDGTYTLYNWIVNNEVVRNFNFENGLTVWGNNAEFNYIHSSLEMNIYKTILEKNYNKPISKMYMVQFHPNIESFNYIPIKVMYKSTNELFNFSKQQSTVIQLS